MEKKNIYCIVEKLDIVETNDTNEILLDDFLTDEEKGSDDDIYMNVVLNYKDPMMGKLSTYNVINIDKFVKVLNDLRVKKVSHVIIDQWSDHDSYQIEPFMIRRESEYEKGVRESQITENRLNYLNLRKKELEKQLQEVYNKIEKLSE